jgi:hypothetical protein
MTPEMVFECLLVSQDPTVFRTMHRILKDFSIAANICHSASKAANLLGEGGTDLIVIDLDNTSSPELLREVSTYLLRQKPTILAVVADDQAAPGVHVRVKKPVTRESGTKSMRVAYSRMVRDFRKHVRHAVMAPVQAIDDSNRTFSVTITNIGDGGVGLSTKDKQLSAGMHLSFPLLLPGTSKEISIQARVLWTRQYGVAGCEFVRIPPVDLQLLLSWLRARCRIKKPLIDLDPEDRYAAGW